MSDKRNLASEIIDAWQEHFQDSLKDPRLVDLMTENYARFQENIKRTVNSHEQDTDNSLPDDVVAELNELRNHVSQLEQRIAKIEKLIAGSAKTKSRQPKTSA
jgi:Mg2+ and Co2+ transporter CorA